MRKSSVATGWPHNLAASYSWLQSKRLSRESAAKSVWPTTIVAAGSTPTSLNRGLRNKLSTLTNFKLATYLHSLRMEQCEAARG